MTLRTRDHRELVDAHVAFHLSAGVDLVIATDHRSRDGTREILERYEREGCVHLIRKDGERFERGWVNDMARIAATEHGADWVVHSDADEFWWPRGGDLKDVLAAVPPRFGVLHAVWRHFAPRPESNTFFAESMIARYAAQGPWTGSEHPFHPNVNVVHRSDPSAIVVAGNHDVATDRPLLRGWFPIEVLHFPLRSLAQAKEKFTAWRPFLDEGVDDLGAHVDAATASLRSGDFSAHYERYVADENVLAEGIQRGWLAIDTRLRDALRRLAGDGNAVLPVVPRFEPAPVAGSPLDFPRLDLGGEADLANDLTELAEPRVRAQRRVDQLEIRIAALERSPVRRVLVRRRLRHGRLGRIDAGVD